MPLPELIFGWLVWQDDDPRIRIAGAVVLALDAGAKIAQILA